MELLSATYAGSSTREDTLDGLSRGRNPAEVTPWIPIAPTEACPDKEPRTDRCCHYAHFCLPS